MVLSFIMTKPFKPQPNVDGMKPIAQSIQQPLQQVAKADESLMMIYHHFNKPKEKLSVVAILSEYIVGFILGL